MRHGVYITSAHLTGWGL